MSDDPVRWKDGDDAPEHLRALVEQGRATPRMDDDVRAAIAARLASLPAGASTSGASAESTSTTGAAAPASTNVITGASGMWIAGGIVAVGIIAAVAWTGRDRVVPSPSSTAAAPLSIVPPSSSAEAAPPSPRSSAVVVPSSEEVPSATSPVFTAVHPSTSSRPDSPGGVDATTAESGSLSKESALVERARSKLATDPSSALGILDEHGRRFPRGELAPERDYLRVSALRRLGRRDEAKTRARSYLATYPSSSYAPVVRTILAELEAP